MESVGPIAATPPSAASTRVQRPPTPRPADPDHDARPAKRPLDPPVSFEPQAADGAQSASERRGYVRLADERAVVFQVTDAVSGDVIVQIPDETVIKARAYARQPQEPARQRVEKTA